MKLLSVAFRETLKTLAWWPRSLMELLEGDLAPDVGGLLFMFVIGMAIIATWIFGLAWFMWTDFGRIGDFPFLPLVLFTAFVYMFLGVLVRFLLWDRGMLR